MTKHVNLEHSNKEPIVNFKFARLACSPFLCYKSTTSIIVHTKRDTPELFSLEIMPLNMHLFKLVLQQVKEKICFK